MIKGTIKPTGDALYPYACEIVLPRFRVYCVGMTRDQALAKALQAVINP